MKDCHPEDTRVMCGGCHLPKTDHDLWWTNDHVWQPVHVNPTPRETT